MITDPPSHVKRIGPYTTTEIPQAIGVQFIDEDTKEPIDLTGFTSAIFVIVKPGGTAGGAGGSFGDKTLGETSFQWLDTDLSLEGRYTGQMWTTNATNELASKLFVFDVFTGTPSPF